MEKTDEIVPDDRTANEFLSDFVVKSKNKVFKCHRFQLAKWSPVFTAIQVKVN